MAKQLKTTSFLKKETKDGKPKKYNDVPDHPKVVRGYESVYLHQYSDHQKRLSGALLMKLEDVIYTGKDNGST